MFSTSQIVLVCLYYFLYNTISFSTQWIGYAYPVLNGLAVGLLMGDVQTGLLVGGTMCLMSLGVGSFGGSPMPDYGLGTVIATAFTIGTGGGMETALAVGIPVATLGTQLDVLTKMCGSFFVHKEMDASVKHEFKKMGLWVHGWNVLRGVLGAIPVLLFMTVGSDIIVSVLASMPAWLTNGLNTAAGMLPAVGFATLMKFLPVKEYGVFLILGFVLASYLGMPIIGISLLAFVAAFMIYKGLIKGSPVLESTDEGGNYDE